MQGFIEDSKGKKPNKAKIDKQKEVEISAIQRSIVRYHLSKFCRANAVALAVIFKALIRGEAIYPKVQFLQDLSAERLLCRKEKESQQVINQENSQNSIQKNKEILKSPNMEEKDTISGEDSAIAKSQSKPQETKNNKRKSQENTSQDSTANVESKRESSSVFPLNIEG